MPHDVIPPKKKKKLKMFIDVYECNVHLLNHCCNSFCNNSFTIWGFAFPFVTLITCPTNHLKTFWLPSRTSFALKKKDSNNNGETVLIILESRNDKKKVIQNITYIFSILHHDILANSFQFRNIINLFQVSFFNDRRS